LGRLGFKKGDWELDDFLGESGGELNMSFSPDLVLVRPLSIDRSGLA
jgi:hypothetical protein